MAQALGLRATSFAASAALLGLCAMAAMSVSITLRSLPSTDPPIVPIVRLDEPRPAPPIARERPPPQAPAQDQTIDAAPPVAPAAPAEIAFPFVPREAGPPEITNPHWLVRPRNLASYYPRRALARAITGEVLLDCRVSALGALECTIISETPENWGFGAAAQRIARDHRMTPASRDGVAVEGRYRMRVPFELR
jgi:protein TonB